VRRGVGLAEPSPGSHGEASLVGIDGGDLRVHLGEQQVKVPGGIRPVTGLDHHRRLDQGRGRHAHHFAGVQQRGEEGLGVLLAEDDRGQRRRVDHHGQVGRPCSS
jgi:hypothetical protein